VLIAYEGCGCAGGLETTILGELVPKDDGDSVEGVGHSGAVAGVVE